MENVMSSNLECDSLTMDGLPLWMLLARYCSRVLLARFSNSPEPPLFIWWPVILK